MSDNPYEWLDAFIAGADSALVVLDFDGTLNRDWTNPAPERRTLRALRALDRRFPLVILTARAAEETMGMLDGASPVVIGASGAEVLRRGEGLWRDEQLFGAWESVQAARQAGVRQLAEKGIGTAGLVQADSAPLGWVSLRGLKPADRPGAMEVLERAAEGFDGVSVTRRPDGLEYRPRGLNKAIGLDRALGRFPHVDRLFGAGDEYASDGPWFRRADELELAAGAYLVAVTRPGEDRRLAQIAGCDVDGPEGLVPILEYLATATPPADRGGLWRPDGQVND